MPADREMRAVGRAMGTTYTIVVHADDGHLVPDATNELERLEHRWSRFRPTSEISVLNRAGGRPVIVSPETFTVVAHALAGARLTGGRFDPTVHDTLHAIGYDRSFDDIDQAGGSSARAEPVAAPGIVGIDLDEALHAITLPVGVRLDLGGIGKGAAADHVCAGLLAAGARGAAVSIGGDLRVQGESPAGGAWQPTYDGAPLAVAPLADGAVCTSSTTRRRWRAGGRDRHHLVDPRRGTCTDGTIESVTVIGATATQAEVLTKAAIVAGDEAGALLADFGVTAFVRRRDRP